MAKNKKPKHLVPSAAKTAAQPQKRPRIEEQVDFWGSRPSWSFSLLDLVAPVGGWIHLRPEELDELLARFRQWETMTWSQILAEAGRKRNHPVDVSQMIPESQERLKVLKLDDYEQLMSLGVNARARVFGIVDRGTFRILWWDPEHRICPAPKKHT